MCCLRPITALTALVLVLGLTATAARATDPAALAREGEDLYRKGAYAEALKKLEAAIAAGVETPSILYQAGNCYRQALSNKDKDLELKRKAIPLLEKEIAGGTASVDSYYYLAAIHINDLGDPVKGTDVARRGVAQIESRKSATPTAPDQMFRAGRLYTFIGKEAQAVGWYDKYVESASSTPAATDRAALRLSLEAIGAHRFRMKEYEASAKAYEALLKINPLDDQTRHQYGRSLLMAARPEEAAKAWRAARSEDLRTELTYLAAVADKYAALGMPDTSKYAPKIAALDHGTLQSKIVEAAGPLRAARLKEEEEKKAREEKERAEREAAEKARVKDPEKVKAMFRAKRESAPPPPDPNATKTDSGLPWQALRDMGLNPVQPPPPPPPSPERVAAEKEFFALLTEYVRRGHLIRNFCFENGLVEMIFR